MANTVTIHTKTVDDGGLVKLRGQFDSLGKGMASSTAVGVLGAKALGFGIGLVDQAAHAAVGAIFDSVKAASDLNETIQKSSVVFGTSAAEIKRWGEGAASSIGLSENAAIAAAASIGNLLLSTGTAPQKIAPMSEAIVKLAADLASFNNIPIEDALAKLQSGLVGQERPLRELGVAISAASVDAEALALGYKKVNGVFTEGEKVQARYALIFKQTGTAQGDFARTSNQLANQQRILQAELDDTSAALGTQMLPIVLDLERAFVGLGDAINGLPSQTNPIADNVGNLLKGGTLDQLKTARDALAKGVNDPILNMFAAPAAEALRKQLALVDAAIADFAAGTGVSSGKVADDFHTVRIAFQRVSDGIRSGSDIVAKAYDTSGKAALDFAADAEKTQRRVRAANDLTVTQLSDDARALIDKAFGPWKAAQTELADNAVIQAARRVIASGKATSAEKRDAYDTIVSTSEDSAQQLLILAQAGDTTSTAYKDGLKNLKQNIKDTSGPTHDALQRVLDAINAIKTAGKDFSVTLTLENKGNMSPAALDKVAKDLGYIGNTDLYKRAYKPPAHNAGGGWVGMNGPELSWVGEKGPEYVVSNDKLGSLGSGPAGPGSMSGSGSVAISLNWQTVFPPTPAQAQQAGRLIVPAVAQEFVRRGLIPRRTLSGVTG